MQPIIFFMKLFGKILSGAVLSLSAGVAFHAVGETPNLVDSIADLSNGRIVINQPDELMHKILADTLEYVEESRERVKHGTKVIHKGGYRIQVYSDNHPRLAKSNVSRIASQVSSAFPSMRCYTVYKAPYWRLKVGDFEKREEAVEKLRKMKSKFPNLAGDMIVVRDRVNVVE